MSLKQVKISELKFDDKNANKHTEQGKRLLDKSITTLGLGRSILLDKDLNIIAGNGVTESAGENGIEDVIIVPTDGTKIIAVQRTDVKLDSKKGRRLAIADNQTAKVGIEFDFTVIEDLNNEYDLDLKAEWEMPNISSMTADELNAFFQPDTSEPKPEKCVITLEYSQEEGERVKTELLRRGNSYEQAVWTLLGLG